MAVSPRARCNARLPRAVRRLELYCCTASLLISAEFTDKTLYILHLRTQRCNERLEDTAAIARSTLQYFRRRRVLRRPAVERYLRRKRASQRCGAAGAV